jgi:REP element-mobilizing transposase RayT
LAANIDALRDSVRRVRARAPFHIAAWVVLADHMHCLWTLPQDDADFPGRWRVIKTGFAKSLPIGEPRSPVMTRRGERGIWQRRYWEHTIRGTIATLRLTWTICISTRSSMVWWRTRRTGHIRHFAGASLAECIPPTGGAAAMNRNRLANGSEIEASETGRSTRPLH